MKKRDNAFHPPIGIKELDHRRFKLGPVMGEEIRRPDQDNFAAGFNTFAQLTDPVVAGILRQDPFIKPDLESVIAKAAGEVFRPIFLSAIVAEKDVVLEALCGHALACGGEKNIPAIAGRFNGLCRPYGALDFLNEAPQRFRAGLPLFRACGAGVWTKVKPVRACAKPFRTLAADRHRFMRSHILISISANSAETNIQRRSLQPAGRVSASARLKQASSENSCRVSAAASSGLISIMRE